MTPKRCAFSCQSMSVYFPRFFFKERVEDMLCVPYLAECSGMWEHSAFFSPGFVFIALTQEAHSGGASFMLSEKRWLPSHPHLSGCPPRYTHNMHFFFSWLWANVHSPIPHQRASFIALITINKWEHLGSGPLPCTHNDFVSCGAISVHQPQTWFSHVYISVLKIIS